MAKVPTKKTDDNLVMDIKPLRSQSVEFLILGTTPLIYHAVAQKAWQELLLPRGRMNDAAKAENIKHDPIAEYRNSVYQWSHERAATRLMVPATMFKGAMMEAAVRLPGVAKTEIAQLVWVTGDRDLDIDSVAIYGKPELRMDIVRMSDIGKTPDVRTRACLREWCCRIVVRFATPLLTATAIGNLLATSGMICGIGDYRQQKGKGSNGQFDLVDVHDAEALARWEAVTRQDKAVQDHALANPETYDRQTDDVLAWFATEITRRGRDASVTRSSGPDMPPAEVIAATRKAKGNGRSASA